MFQYGDNDINSYNSLSMNQTAKGEFKSSKIYSSSKIIMTNEISSLVKKSQKNSQNKKAILDMKSQNAKTLITEKEENNENNENNNNNNLNEMNFSQNDINSTKNLTKLPKITKYTIQTNLIVDKKFDQLNNNQLLSIANSIDKTVSGDHLYHTKHQLFFNDQFKNNKNNKNQSKKRKNSLRLSGAANFESIQFHKQQNLPSENGNVNMEQKAKMKNEPKLGKMKEYIILPDFVGDEPLTEMIFNPVLEDNLIKPQNEKQYEVNLYLNSHKMMNNLIYLKIPVTKDGLIPTQNIINVKKIFNENRYKEDEDEIQDIIKEKENQKPISANDENVPLIIPKNKNYVSISEYPGNYKPNNNNEKELRLAHNMLNKMNPNENNDNNMIESTRGSINLNAYDICKRNQNNSEIYGEKNSENYVSKSIHLQNGHFYENRTDKNDNENSLIKHNNSSELNDLESNNNDKTIILNTIYGGIRPYYKLRDDKDETLIFESRFESGNLLCAFKIEEDNYQLYLQNDTNTTGYIQWFFFRVSNTRKGKKTNFTIINMLRSSCVYKKGLKIMVYSKLQALNENIGWHRDCENIMYYTNNLFTYNDNSKKKRSLNSLSFQYEFKYDNDTVYFANCLPYFYSKLVKQINFYEKKYKSFYVKKEIITHTLGGNELFYLNISQSKPQNIINSEISLPQLNKSLNQPFQNLLNSSNSFKFRSNDLDMQQKNNNSKKAVIMIARQHPGETVGSHVIKGCIDFLLGDSEEAKKLRELYNFIIVPMMNPDGVLVGNSRTSFAGCDLNRRWSKPNEIIHPEIYYTKSIILKTSLKQNISFIIDFHGHFGTFNSLFYCNHKENKQTCSLFPYLCSKLSNIISFQQSTFSMPKYKNSTERLTLFRELKDEDNNNIIASETSFFGTKNGNNEKNYYYNTKLLNEIGRDCCLGMLSYYIKCANITLENNLNFFSDIEKLQKLDVDMREFESDLIREVNEDDDQEGEEELSESEPSIDNFDKKEIMRLMPVFQKKKKKKGKGNNANNKTKKLEKYFGKRKTAGEKNNADKKNIDLDIVLYNPLKIVTVKKVEDDHNSVNIKKNLIAKEKNNNPPPIKSSSNTSINFKKSKNAQNQNNKNITVKMDTEPNYKNDYTQTEEIFFRMHWTFFVGKFRILNGRKHMNNNLPNISTIPINMAKLNNNYINPFAFPTNKRKDLLMNGKIKNTNWTKFGNIFVDEKNLNPLKIQNGNIKIIKSSVNDFNKNSLIKEKSSIKPIFVTRFNGNTLNRKANNFTMKGSNKNSVNKDKKENDNNNNNVGNKGKNSGDGKIKDENNNEKNTTHS